MDTYKIGDQVSHTFWSDTGTINEFKYAKDGNIESVVVGLDSGHVAVWDIDTIVKTTN